MAKILVTGSRTWTNREQIWQWVKSLPEDTVIVHGASRSGVDHFVNEYAQYLGLQVVKYPVGVGAWKKFGKSAGPRRNKFMLTDSHPDAVQAFRAKGHSPGTDGMLDLATRHTPSIPVFIVKEEPLKDDPT